MGGGDFCGIFRIWLYKQVVDFAFSGNFSYPSQYYKFHIYIRFCKPQPKLKIRIKYI